MFHTVVQRGLYEMVRDFFYLFVGNLFLFPTVKSFKNRLTAIAKVWHHVFKTHLQCTK